MTLRAAVEWSHQLLSEPERILFRRLSVFAGAFDLQAPERVAAGEQVDELEVLDLLTQLVNKSLLVTSEDAEGMVRYRLLETLRQYAAERLQESDEEVAAHDRHLAYFLDMAEHAFAERIEAETAWVARLEQDHDDLRAALDWALGRRPADALRLAGALGWFWYLHGHLSEGRTHLAAALEGRREAGPDLARALWSGGTLAGWQGDVEAARPLLEESRRMYEAWGDRLGIAMCLDSMGWALIIAGDAHGALSNWEEALGIQRELGDARGIELARVAVCQGLVAVKDVESAEPMAAEILAVGQESRDARSTHFGYHFLADCALMRADVAAAERLYGDSLRAALVYDDAVDVTFEVEGVAMSAAGMGDARPALRLGGAVEARREELGMYMSISFWNEFQELWFGVAREALGPEASAAAWSEGRAMGWDAAVREALERKG
ncbi:MAG: ATP-binding protein [Gemmatimonadota bacterium]